MESDTCGNDIFNRPSELQSRKCPLLELPSLAGLAIVTLLEDIADIWELENIINHLSKTPRQAFQQKDRLQVREAYDHCDAEVALRCPIAHGRDQASPIDHGILKLCIEAPGQ
jgi:hypothetical protein